MKRIAFAAALVFAGAVSGAAVAAAHDSGDEAPFGQGDERVAAASDERDDGSVRTAEGFFDRFRGDDRDGEHGRHHRHHWDDDDDDDDDGASASAGRGARPADPNSAAAPVPDNGVFNGKARPKVEVQ